MTYGRLRRIKSGNDYTEMCMRFGSFGYVRGLADDGSYLVSAWETCRDTFQSRIREAPVRVFVIFHNVNRSYSIASFVDRVEQMVKTKPRTVIGPTQYDKVSYVRMSSWWLKNDMRISLFTALLRAGQYYDPEFGNFEQALCATRYTRQTLPAVQWFLKGHTCYTGKVTGWNDQFFHNGKIRGRAVPPTEREIRSLLVRPRSAPGT